MCVYLICVCTLYVCLPYMGVYPVVCGMSYTPITRSLEVWCTCPAIRWPTRRVLYMYLSNTCFYFIYVSILYMCVSPALSSPVCLCAHHHTHTHTRTHSHTHTHTPRHGTSNGSSSLQVPPSLGPPRQSVSEHHANEHVRALYAQRGRVHPRLGYAPISCHVSRYWSTIIIPKKWSHLHCKYKDGRLLSHQSAPFWCPTYFRPFFLNFRVSSLRRSHCHPQSCSHSLSLPLSRFSGHSRPLFLAWARTLSSSLLVLSLSRSLSYTHTHALSHTHMYSLARSISHARVRVPHTQATSRMGRWLH